MRLRTFTSERDNHRAEITFMRIAVGGLVLALLANAGALLGVAGSERTVLVPPEVHKSFWVSGEKVSGDYLQEMAYWYAGLALNITPHVAEYQKGSLPQIRRPQRIRPSPGRVRRPYRFHPQEQRLDPVFCAIGDAR
jgi:hypothetical protein